MFVICGNYSFHVKTIHDKNLGDAVLVVMYVQILKKDRCGYASNTCAGYFKITVQTLTLILYGQYVKHVRRCSCIICAVMLGTPV